MGILSDIYNTTKDVLRNVATVGDVVSKKNTKSFARGANEQTIQFPCIISDSIPIDMSTTIARNLDRVYASFTQIYLSANGVIDLNYIKNPRQFIAQYQNNFSLESADDDLYSESEKEVIESVNNHYKDFYNGEPRLYMTDDNERGFMFTESESIPAPLIRSMKAGMKESLSQYNLSVIQPYVESKSKNEIKGDIVSNYLNSLEDEEKNATNERNVKATQYEQTPRMLERDIKKINDMQPYAMDLKILATKGDTSFAQYMTFTIGVKTTLHLGKSKSLIDNIAYVLKNKRFSLNFIRWTTGELSLLKDIIFKVNDTNFNVSNRSDQTGRMISKLKDLKKRKVKVSTTGLSRLAPFATLVISQYEYNEILTKYGFDLKNVVFAKKLMSELFLMGFVIVDETTQTIDMLLDGSKTGFQTYSLDTLQREVTMNSNKLGQELTRMLGSSR